MMLVKFHQISAISFNHRVVQLGFEETSSSSAFFIKPSRRLEYRVIHFLFSAHISYGKGKYLNQTGFFFFFFTKFAKILFIFKFKGVTHRIQPT